MKFELDENERIKITSGILQDIRADILANQAGAISQDVIFDIDGIAEYLKVKKTWIYQRVHEGSIPHYKLGKYPRFRKSVIDEWLKESERAGSGFSC